MRLRRIPALDRAERAFLGLLKAGSTVDDGGRIAADPTPNWPADPPPRFWPRLLELARDHRLAGYLHAAFAAQPVWRTVPAAVQTTLRQLHAQTALRNSLYQQQTRLVLAALAREGIEPILLKGAALNATVYRDAGERGHADVDLLISPDELERARAAMLSSGFVLDESFMPETFYRAHHFHLVFFHETRPWCRFEIHWDLASPIMDVPLDIAAWRARATARTTAAGDLRLLGTEDFLLHLCLHAALGGFAILSQIRDVHALLADTSWPVDPDRFWREARRIRVVRPCLIASELAGWFGAVPQLADLADAAPRGGDRRVLRAMLRPETVLRQRLLDSTAGHGAISMLRRDRWRDRLRFLSRMVSPSSAEAVLHGQSQAAATGSSLAGVLRASGVVAFMMFAGLGSECIRHGEAPGSEDHAAVPEVSI